MGTASTNEVKKLQVEEIVLFAINNIPDVDTTTLKQFLELVNAGGTFGTISHDQIIKKMHKVLKYIPGASVHSLLVLTDLLEIELPVQPLLRAPRKQRLEAQTGIKPMFIDAAAKATNSTKNLYAR